jgi:hypothetical protein
MAALFCMPSPAMALLRGAASIIRWLWASYARPKVCKSGVGTTLNYNRRESAFDPRYIHAFSGRDARLPKWEESGGRYHGASYTSSQLKLTCSVAASIPW